jgi:hypothetical protein
MRNNTNRPRTWPQSCHWKSTGTPIAIHLMRLLAPQREHRHSLAR